MKKSFVIILIVLLSLVLFVSCNDSHDKKSHSNSTPVVEEPQGDKNLITGKFSVDSGKQVQFTKGNVQYIALTDSWRFASKQWSYIGNAAGNDTILVRNIQASAIDLFGWGATGENSYSEAPYSDSTDDKDYKTISGDPNSEEELTIANKADWGACFGGKYRTLSSKEWKYLLDTRDFNGSTGEGYSYQRIYVKVSTSNTVFGLLIYPDSYTSQRTKKTSEFETLTQSEFSDFEDDGCVFLPAGGFRREGYYVEFDGDYGYYWASDAKTNVLAYCMWFANKGKLTSQFMNYRNSGMSVRLVADVTED